MTLNGVMAVALRYFTEFGKPVIQCITASICGGIYARVLLYFVLRVRYRCKESSRSLSHLLMSFFSATCAPFWQLFSHNFFPMRSGWEINCAKKLVSSWYSELCCRSWASRIIGTWVERIGEVSGRRRKRRNNGRSRSGNGAESGGYSNKRKLSTKKT